MPVTEPISSGTISQEMLPRIDRRKRRSRSVSSSTTLISGSSTNPTDPTAPESAWPDSPLMSMDMRVLGTDDEELIPGLNDCKYVRQGNIVFCTIEVTFGVPEGQMLEKFVGLPYACLWPSLGAIGSIFRASTAERDLVCVRPLLDEIGAFEIWYPDQAATKYVLPADDESYGLALQFFYFTDGRVYGAIWLADADSNNIYLADSASSSIYIAEI